MVINGKPDQNEEGDTCGRADSRKYDKSGPSQHDLPISNLNGGELMLFAKTPDPQEKRRETVNEKHLQNVYQEICTSYRAIDDFRAKLLALLPFATGGGIFFLLNKDIATTELKPFFLPIGLFGFAITAGLFAHEI